MPTPGQPRFFLSPVHLAPPEQQRKPDVASAEPAVADWSLEAIMCIANLEEGGHNSSAGYFGMPSAPSAYPGSAAIVARYGDSWLDIPLEAQLVIAEAEWATYGWHTPWPNTSRMCGL